MALTNIQRDVCRLIARQRIASGDGESVILQWTHDSAFRFFPLVAHPELGLTLHPFDLATNKVLALVGRVEARDWIDILQCDSAVQPLAQASRLPHRRRDAAGPAAETAARRAALISDEDASIRQDAP